MKNLFKIISIFAILLWTTVSAFADNKSDLTTSLNNLTSSASTIQSNNQLTLKNKIYSLSSSIDWVYNSLGFSGKTLEYLLSLTSNTTDVKTSMVFEYNQLDNEIVNKITAKKQEISNLLTNISINYATVSDAQKITFTQNIATLTKDLSDLQAYFTTKLSYFETNYLSTINTTKTTLAKSYTDNKSKIDTLKSFETKVTETKDTFKAFETNYNAILKNQVLSSDAIKLFVIATQKKYNEIFSTNLNTISNTNIESNADLKAVKTEIVNFVASQVKTFENDLKENIISLYDFSSLSDEYKSFSWMLNEYNSLYFDASGKIKATNVLANTSAINSIDSLNIKIKTLNINLADTIKNTANYTNSSDLQTVIENQIIKYYNNSFTTAKAALMALMNEKIQNASLKKNNSIITKQIIDLKYSLLMDKVTKLDYTTLETEINTFQKYISTYSTLQDSSVDLKITEYNNSTTILMLQKKLAQDKYSYAKNKYRTLDFQLKNTFDKLYNWLQAQSEDYLNLFEKRKLEILVRVNNALTKVKAWSTAEYVVLKIKLALLTYEK